ncbi:hypothetical protein [Pseudanabaena sp. BC1403]|nr:hypothetical protein [Pseudanabaena sp. BC1403]
MATVQVKTDGIAELELLQKINQALPEEIQRKYNDLSAKMRS